MQDQTPSTPPAENTGEAPLMRINRKRPAGITAISWILIVVSVLGLLSAFLASLSPDYNTMLAGNRLPIPMQKVFGSLGLLVVFLSGLFMRDGAVWAKWLYLGYMVFVIFLTIANLGLTPLIFPGLILYALSAVVLFGKNSSAFFGSENSTDKNGKAQQPKRTYALAAFCLVLGLALGYSLWGTPGSKALTASTQAGTETRDAANHSGQSALQNETFIRAVTPLIEAVNKNPGDFKAMVKLANLYDDEQHYPEAIQYYERALGIHPEDPDVRTDLGSVWFHSGNADRAIAEYQKSLSYQPDHANALFNLGIVRWKSKTDRAGALAAWEELLRRNPNFPERRQVEELIKTVRSQSQ